MEVLSNTLPKSLQGKPLTASALIFILKEAVDDLNTNDHINFSKIWRRCIENECKVALANACAQLTDLLEDGAFLKDDLSSTNRLIAQAFIKQDAFALFQPVSIMAQSKRDNETVIKHVQKLQKEFDKSFQKLTAQHRQTITEFLNDKDAEAFVPIHQNSTPSQKTKYSDKSLPFDDFKSYLTQFSAVIGQVSDEDLLEHLSVQLPKRLQKVHTVLKMIYAKD